MGTGSCNGGNRRGVGGRRPALQLRSRCIKFWRPSLDVPHLSVGGGLEAQASDRQPQARKLQGTGRGRILAWQEHVTVLHGVHTPRTNSCVCALAMATRLVAVHSHHPWWSFVTGCSSREPLGWMEYDVRRSKSTCQRDQNLSNRSRHSPDMHE